MKVLLLGGTSDARRMADYLHKKRVCIIYSVAGLVRLPTLPCDIVSGGFSQFGGLANYIEQQEVSVVLDMTHPYAVKMSSAAREAASDKKIRYWRFDRPAWQAQPSDRWQELNDWQSILQHLAGYQHVFLSAGQIKRAVLNQIIEMPAVKKVILRTAVKPSFNIPPFVEWIKAIGPFDLSSELDLFNGHAVDVVVSKNSGGNAVVSKLHAARELGIPVLMLSRPVKYLADKNFSDESSCGEFVVAQCAPR